MRFCPRTGPGLQLDVGAIYVALGLMALFGISLIVAFVQVLRRAFTSAAIWAGMAGLAGVVLFGPGLFDRIVDWRREAGFAFGQEAEARQDPPAYELPPVIHFPSLEPGDVGLCPERELWETPVNCPFAPKSWLSTGMLDAVETGTDPVLRWTWLWRDPLCFDPARLNGPLSAWRDSRLAGVVARHQGGCLWVTPVARPQSSAQIHAERVTGTEAVVYRLDLIDTVTGKRLDEAYAYKGAAPGEGRNRDWPLARLLLESQFTRGDLRDRNRFDNAIFRMALNSSLAAKAMDEVCNAKPPYPLDPETLDLMRSKQSELEMVESCLQLTDP